jgi:hypothetical protein
MLKMTNRLLQWLRSVPKPLSGLFRHLNRSKNEEDSLLEVSLFNFVVSGSTNRTLVLQTWLTRSFKRKNLAPGATAPTVQTVGRLRRLQPLTASALGHMAHATKGSAKKVVNSVYNRVTSPRVQPTGQTTRILKLWSRFNTPRICLYNMQTLIHIHTM